MSDRMGITRYFLLAMLLGTRTAVLFGQCGAAWDGTVGQPGMTGGSVFALAVFDDGGGPALYAGGVFSQAGGTNANNIAKWDGSSWSPLGTGTNSVVQALTVYDDGTGPALYVGGFFDTAGGLSSNRIAKWDGSSWAPLGTGVDNSVTSLTVFDDSSGPALYAGGQFSTAGGVGANRIAKWDGAAWAPLGSGLNNTVSALAATQAASAIGPGLYVGGNFTTAGGSAALRVAKWDGAAWSALSAEGMNLSVLALAVFDDGSGLALYAGGKFTSAGGVAANYIAKWDGSSWSPLGSGMNDRVHALAVFDEGTGAALYAGGEFTTAGGVSANHIAKWDGSSWSPLGSGTNDAVEALGTADGTSPIGPGLYAGGPFTQAGGMTAVNVAKWACTTVAGDLDGDGDVDLDDFAMFAACYNGSMRPPAGTCPPGVDADLDADGDCDLDDFAIFAANYTGSL